MSFVTQYLSKATTIRNSSTIVDIEQQPPALLPRQPGRRLFANARLLPGARASKSQKTEIGAKHCLHFHRSSGAPILEMMSMDYLRKGFGTYAEATGIVGAGLLAESDVIKNTLDSM